MIEGEGRGEPLAARKTKGVLVSEARKNGIVNLGCVGFSISFFHEETLR